MSKARSASTVWAHQVLERVSGGSRALSGMWRPGLQVRGGSPGDSADDLALRRLPARRARAAILFIVGNMDTAARGQLAERIRALEAVGVSTATVSRRRLHVDDALERYAGFVLNNVANDAELARFLARAREADRMVVADGHDLDLPSADSGEGLRVTLDRRAPELSSRRSLTINWAVRSPLAERSGSARTIFRLANDLGRRGHRVRVYIDPVEHLVEFSPGQIIDYLERHFGPLAVEAIIGLREFGASDAMIATSWRTADAVVRDPRSLFRFRFLQDFEEAAYQPNHRYHRRACDSYALPLQPIALGRSFGTKVTVRCGRAAESIDLAIDESVFRVTTPPEDRAGPLRLLFYARPDLLQRGYQIGVETLRRFHEDFPEAEISFFGSMEENVGHIPFPYRWIGIPGREELAQEMNRSHLLLSLSLSEQVSRVSLEAMACGVAVVGNGGADRGDVLPAGKGCLFAEPDPSLLADALSRLAGNRDELNALATSGAQEMSSHDWPESLLQFEEILLRRCFAATETVARPSHLYAAAG